MPSSRTTLPDGVRLQFGSPEQPAPDLERFDGHPATPGCLDRRRGRHRRWWCRPWAEGRLPTTSRGPTAASKRLECAHEARRKLEAHEQITNDKLKACGSRQERPFAVIVERMAGPLAPPREAGVEEEKLPGDVSTPLEYDWGGRARSGSRARRHLVDARIVGSAVTGVGVNGASPRRSRRSLLRALEPRSRRCLVLQRQAATMPTWVGSSLLPGAGRSLEHGPDAAGRLLAVHRNVEATANPAAPRPVNSSATAKYASVMLPPVCAKYSSNVGLSATRSSSCSATDPKTTPRRASPTAQARTVPR